MVYGWGSEQFLRYFTFYEMKGVGHALRVCPGGPKAIPINVPYLKEEEYIWFMGGDLNSF